jgi:riboflavin kinase/FMN adenylyltransferase
MERHPCRISGTVTKGDKYGKLLGFPTANLSVEGFLTSEPGIYAGIASVGSLRYKASIVITPAPVGESPKVEAYLLGFSGELYGKTVFLELRGYLRPYMTFDDSEALRLQIREDVERTDELITL